MDLGIYIHKVKKDDFETAMKYNHIAISLENEYQKYCRRKLEHYGCFYEKLDNLLSDKPVISPRIPLDLNPEPYFIYFHKLDNFRDRYLSELKEYSKEYLGNHKYRQITEKTSKFCVLGELPENKFLDNSDDDIKYIGKLRYLKEDLSSNKLLLSHALCQRYCIMCGRKFFSTKKALFCSYECRSQYHLRKKKYESNIRICPICGKPITGRKDKRTCSNACRTALSRKKRKIS
ncbi:putative nucleic acid-binding Zn ribbon protein [Methanomicrobium sp. W14]|uniref:DUF2116 family Zn-ribbon domain-containing protein n=1 Tax=Methanomicrobium sp. W14 TaxID=2817839 RepID=UPI001AE1E416|nr:DUF2116 family Zn-ribbon domain-containing protein [Methanomicrobium sp. W14]MBP2133968.1 putative nucleic acid-binding Zn ribbon protein [Methanomicrobium sp. W14]